MFRTIPKRLFSTIRPLQLSYQTSFKPMLAEKGFAGAVGNTPLIKLNKLSKETGRNIFGKAEWMNPGGSVKDRAALWLIERAEERGWIKPGGTIVEGTAGNTGIGLAHICRAKGYKCVIFLNNIQAPAKIETLQLLGAEVHAVPPEPFTSPKNFNHLAAKYAKEHDNCYYTDQFENFDNYKAHMESTGPEIYQQLNGKVGAFTCSLGSGGTYAGVSEYLKGVDPSIKSFVAEPYGSSVYAFIKTKGKSTEWTGSSFTEGIGQHRITGNARHGAQFADDAFLIPDNEVISMLYRLIDDEGIFVGSTAALNVVAAVRAAKLVPPGSNVATIFTDSAHKYASRFFSKKWLKAQNLYEDIPPELRKYAALD